MSCQIKQTAGIVDLQSVRRHLYPSDNSRGGDNWLQNCKISLSPTGDIFALVHDTRLVLLTGKWDSQSSTNLYLTSPSSFQDFKEKINAVLCLPIVVPSQSSQVGPDWTCITLGFESGNVVFLTETGTVLLEEQLHNEPVNSIKCQSQHSPRPDISPELKPEELHVIYNTNVCVIGGVHLFSILRSCRSQLAKAQSLSHVDVTLLSTNPKKWGFDQNTVNDAGVVGLDLTSTFNHLLTASTCGGFDSKYRAMPPHNSLVVTSGSKPFVGFHYALEGGAQPVLSDVAKAVASKLKSALPGWITGAKSTPEKQQTVSTLPTEAMVCRYGLCDLRRVGNTIVLSPDKKLAVIADGLGRVLLIDSYRGVALRMFKGYREAQCAFIQVPDERKTRRSTRNAIALFLIIYSAKKGTIEIFCAQQGTKIAAFTASKNSVLLYMNYGLMGFQNTSKSKFICQYTCVLLDPDGQLKEIIIPFHFALTEKNSKRARDLHLLKRLKQFIKTGQHDEEKLMSEVSNTCAELKTTEIKMQYVEMIIASKELPPEVIYYCGEYFLEKLTTHEGELDPDMNQLKLLAENTTLITQFFMFISSASHAELDVTNGNVENHPSDTKLVLPQKEMNNLQKLLDLSTLNDHLKEQKSVSFQETFNLSPAEFISTFDIVSPDCIKLKDNLPDNKVFLIAEKIFKKYINQVNNYDELELQVADSRIVSGDLFNLLLHYWVNRSLNTYINLEKEMENFSQTLYTLTKTLSSDLILAEYNSLSPFWSTIREILANSSKPFPALMAAILCKSVAQKIENEKDLQHSSTSIEDENNLEIWEKLSQENVQWTLLIGKLEDVSLLNIILANKPICENTLPKLNCDRADVSLRYILEKGKGSVSEIVAQWLATGGVSPEDVILNDLSSGDEPSQSTEVAVNTNTIINQPVFEHLNIIKKQFPYSVEPSMLLSNMCWEYALAWQKDIQDLSLLEASIKCLNHIPNLHIKTGLNNLVWNTHLKIVFESACKLINKVGKLPKERLCRQDTDLSDYQITLFMNICADFFDNFMETLQDCQKYEKPKLQYEPIWETDAKPLMELALSQNEINYDLLHLHYQLALAMHMLTVFAIKHTKLIHNIFSASVVSYFFTDLQQKVPVNWHKTDSKVNASRLQFLIKVISASLETVTMDEGKIYSLDHISWIAKCISLARFWTLDVDLLRRFQVAQIFSNGFDALGEELLPTVTEVNKLGPDLVSIAGKRLAQILAGSQDLGEKITAFSPTLTRYLDTLNGEWHTPSDLEATMTLITHCLRCLEENQPEYKMACLMLEACSALQEMN